MDNWNDDLEKGQQSPEQEEQSQSQSDTDVAKTSDILNPNVGGAQDSEVDSRLLDTDAIDTEAGGDNSYDDSQSEGADGDEKESGGENEAEGEQDKSLRVINDGETAISDVDDGERRGRRGKQREPMPKKKKIVIAVIAAVLIAAILVAIIVPVVFYVKDKIFVSNAEQFLSVDWSSNTKKYVYLKKDIVIDGDATLSGLIDIDLNKHSLQVNGTLTINAAEGSMTIGTKKGKSGYSDKGSLTAGNLVINAPTGSVILECDAYINGASVNAAKFASNRFMSLGGAFEVVGGTSHAIFGGTLSGSGDAKVYARGGWADVSGVSQVAISAEQGGYVSVSGSAIAIDADAYSYVVLDGGKADSVKGGSGVLALKNYKCAEFSGMSKLGLFVSKDAEAGKIENVGNMFYIEQLEAPASVNVIREGNDSELNVASVYGSGVYIVKINDIEPFEVADTKCDITGYITTPGRYSVSVKSKGNFAIGADGKYDIDALGADSRYFIDSDYTTVEYDYTFTLETPDKVFVNNDNGAYSLKFETVSFADYYNIYIGDKVIVCSQEDAINNGGASITEALQGRVGSVVVYIEACSNNEQIFTSQRAMASVIIRSKLTSPSANYSITGNNLAVSWSKGDNCIMYEVQVRYLDSEETECVQTVTTSLTSHTFSIDDIGTVLSVKVKALGHGYYNESDWAECSKLN
ncbi:MAG: hypothetical protein K2M44_07200 [Clostridia bacterium]|nr:hypothetical protein [Clostridia bacterium]